MNLIQTLEQEEIARLNKEIPAFAPGDTVIVSVNVVEGNRKRVQAYEGVVIAKRNRGLNSAFIVRKISSGEGVERTFQTYSPMIAKIEVSAVVTCVVPSCTTCVSAAVSPHVSRKSCHSARLLQLLLLSNQRQSFLKKTATVRCSGFFMSVPRDTCLPTILRTSASAR